MTNSQGQADAGRSNVSRWSGPRIAVCITIPIIIVVVIVVVIVVTIPKAKHGSTVMADNNWWKKYAVYQIYPRSFQDSDGDGVGDLQGIISRLDYLKNLGIKIVWLSPIYQSPMADFGYDIADFRAIDPLFGTMDDFQKLVKEIHDREMYLVMDYVPNHSSNEHAWFKKSESLINPYTDYYVWQNATTNTTAEEQQPPNNWLSVFGNSSWQWSEKRQQFYLHQFLIEQPDLNYWNEKVQQEMVDVLSFWLDLGVDGFRMDAVPHLLENNNYTDADEPVDPQHANLPHNDWDYLKHIYTLEQPGTFDTLKRWGQHLNKFGKAHKKHIFSVVETLIATKSTVAEIMNYYDVGVDFPFNFNLMRFDKTTTAAALRELISEWMDNLPRGKWPNWVIGNHDNNRVASRLAGSNYTDMANMILLLLPGTPTCYYGDEIGMTDVFIPFNETQDPFGSKWGPDLYLNFTRDPERTPMQWDDTQNAGFSASKNGTWLPVSEDYRTVNVQAEQSNNRSHLNVFKRLLALRQSKHLLMYHGNNLRFYNGTFGGFEHPMFAFARFDPMGKMDSYLVVCNLGDEASTVQLHEQFASAKLLISSGSYSEYSDGVNLPPQANLTLNGGNGLVFAVKSVL